MLTEIKSEEPTRIEQQPYRYLLRPFLVAGTTSLIHASIPNYIGNPSGVEPDHCLY